MSPNAERVGAIVLLSLMGLSVVLIAMFLLGCTDALAQWQPNPGPWPPPNNPIVIAK